MKSNFEVLVHKTAKTVAECRIIYLLFTSTQFIPFKVLNIHSTCSSVYLVGVYFMVLLLSLTVMLFKQ